MIEKTCNKISKYMALNLHFDKDKEEVIAYGIFAFIQTLYSILLIVIVGLILGMVKEVLIFSLSASFLRRTSGGVHASTPSRCAITGAVISGIISWIIKNQLNNIDMKLAIVFIVLIFIIAYYLIYKLAPVDSKAKPIKSVKKRSELRKKSIKICSLLFLVTTILMINYNTHNNVSLLVFSMCITAGVLWQVLTLTPFGTLLINFIDIIFNKIEFLFGGETNEKKNN